jgi:pimeloyl-ACP methyl ester carboxylesterase
VLLIEKSEKPCESRLQAIENFSGLYFFARESRSNRTARLDDWQRAGKRWDHRGRPIFFRDQGSGEALLLIHGFPTASWDWHVVWEALGERYRLIAPDLIGFGFSAKPVAYEYSIHDQADLIEGLLAELGVGRIHVLAHDYDDTVAQELLARREERRRNGGVVPELASVCFLNGGLFPETHRPRLIQRLLLSPLGPLVGRLMSERRFARSFAAIFGPRTRPSSDELHEFWSLVAHNDDPRIAHLFIRYMDERRRFRARWVGALQSTRVPLRLINGPEDPVSGVHAAERYRELVPDADLVLLEGIGHYPQVEAPQRVVEAYLDFRERIETT